jgi:hypothetical protein
VSARTLLEVDRAGRPVRIFHRVGPRAWTHPVGDPVLVDQGRRGPCPACARLQAIGEGEP